MKLILAILFNSFIIVAYTSCAKLNSQLGIYHERIEWLNRPRVFNHNSLDVIKHYSGIDLLDNKHDYYLVYLFSYGCWYNERAFSYLELVENKNSNLEIYYSCDNLISQKQTRAMVSEISAHAAKSLIFFRSGIKKSLHNNGKYYGYKSTLESYPNNLYLIDRKGKTLYASYAPDNLHLENIISIINSKR